VRKEESVEKIKKHVNFYAKRSEIKKAYFSNMPTILHVYLEAYFNTNDFGHYLFNVYVFLLQDFKDIFPDEILSGLPPIKGNEHQIDLVLETSLPNRSTYRSNLDEINKL
jgi:hypothetical protein